jgi:hypothetical protein
MSRQHSNQEVIDLTLIDDADDREARDDPVQLRSNSDDHDDDQVQIVEPFHSSSVEFPRKASTFSGSFDDDCKARDDAVQLRSGSDDDGELEIVEPFHRACAEVRAMAFTFSSLTVSNDGNDDVTIVAVANEQKYVHLRSDCRDYSVITQCSRSSSSAIVTFATCWFPSAYNCSFIAPLIPIVTSPRNSD